MEAESINACSRGSVEAGASVGVLTKRIEDISESKIYFLTALDVLTGVPPAVRSAGIAAMS